MANNSRSSATLLGVLSIGLLACSKPNPNRCCTTQADCEAQNIPLDNMCQAGLVCRGNQCIALACTTSADCEAGNPYCIPEQDHVCEAHCTADMECPGFGQTTNERFCAGGACVECRDGMDDCGPQGCISGSCGPCAADSQCFSGLCLSDGSCAGSNDVAYASPAGSSSSLCTKSDPCTLERALALPVPPHYVLLATGTYQETSTLTISGQRTLVGPGAGTTSIVDTGPGPVVAVAAGAVAEIRGIQIGDSAGDGISASGTVSLVDDVIASNAGNGLNAAQAAVTALRTRFTGNGTGLSVSNGSVDLDRIEVSTNTIGIAVSDSQGSIRNAFVVANTSTGITVGGTSAPATIAFTTIVGGIPVKCVGTAATAFSQDIMVSMPQNNASCTFPGSLVGNVTGLNFKSPPSDYHLGPGSVAIDAATSCTVDHDYDGDPRPMGAACDVGADEAQ